VGKEPNHMTAARKPGPLQYPLRLAFENFSRRFNSYSICVLKLCGRAVHLHSSLGFDDADIVEGDNALTIYLLNIQEIRFSFHKTNNLNDCKG
jgi:hypothetical protein